MNKISQFPESTKSTNEARLPSDAGLPSKAEAPLPIYLDYAATTPVAPEVLAKMSAFLTKEGAFGNPNSAHIFGKIAKEAVECARGQVASLIQAKPHHIIWTSGATEANNLAIKGVAEFYKRRGQHIVTSQTEHRAVLDTCQALARQGFEITYLRPNKEGRIESDNLQSALREDTILVSLMHINNETGVIQDIASFGKMCRDRGVVFHVDASQSVGKIPIDVNELSVDVMSFSAHKMYGPKGIGALFVNDNPKIRLTAQQHGGGQENGLRSGTLPTHQCVGMGEAFRIAEAELKNELQKITLLRNQFWAGLQDLPGVSINGNLDHALPQILNVCFANQDRDIFIEKCQHLAFSVSSACTGSSLDTSHVLRAMGLKNELAHRSYRFSFGRYTTADEIEMAVQVLREAYLD